MAAVVFCGATTAIAGPIAFVGLMVPHLVNLLYKGNLRMQMLLTALCWLASARERLRKFEKKTLTIEEKMAEIRLVNKAKWILISELHMTEPEAHRYLEKQAMDRCIARRVVAEEIIKTYT